MKRGQIWVETVIYTLIGLAIIGILLAVVRPQINAMTDKLVIEQTIEILNEIDENMEISSGNVRAMDLKISKGSLFINGVNEKIFWVLEESDKKFSEPGVEAELGKVKVITTGDSKPWKVELSIDYSLNINYNGEDVEKEIEATASLYKLYIENKGVGEDGRAIMDLRVE